MWSNRSTSRRSGTQSPDVSDIAATCGDYMAARGQDVLEFWRIHGFTQLHLKSQGQNPRVASHWKMAPLPRLCPLFAFRFNERPRGMRDRTPPPDAARREPQLERRRYLAVAFGCLCFGAVPHAAFSRTPASALSTRAITRRTPALKADLDAIDLRLGAPVFLRILKHPGVLEVFVENNAKQFIRFRSFPICTFSGEFGPKLRTGDGQAPEGFYAVGEGRMNPYSSYHLSFDLGYPNAFDRVHGRTGSALMVHGNCVSIGCYAMGDDAIEQIWTLMELAFTAGQKVVRVHAFPFAMTAENLKAQGKNQNADFWANLKEGWDWFETNRRPPNVTVANKRYTFSTA
jgi:murein L,D-transpeptidase YafK